jgi:adenylate cyclase
MTSLALNCDRCSFFLNAVDTGELYSRVAQGIRRREIRLLNNDGVIGAAFQTGRSIIIGNAYADPRFNPTIDRETGYVTKTVLCVPLSTALRGRLSGWLERDRRLHSFAVDAALDDAGHGFPPKNAVDL